MQGSNVSVPDAEIYEFGVGWTQQPPSPSQRVYHAVAVLLPDARVLVGGGEQRQPGIDTDYDIFEPPYLQGNPVRPTISNIKDASGSPMPRLADGTTYRFVLSGSDKTFKVECQIPPTGGVLSSVAKIVLIAPASMTHHSDMSARYVELPSKAQGTATRIVTILGGAAGVGSGMVPRGFYMLFALSDQGVPSVAAWVRVE